MRSKLQLIALACMCACRPADEAADEAPSRAEHATAPSGVELVGAMEVHYEAAIRGQDALVQGDVEAFRAAIGVLGRDAMPEHTPVEWSALRAELRTAAHTGTEAGDLSEAATAMGGVALACGTCHQTLGKGPVYPVPPVRSEDDPVEAEMRGHEWATLMLWDGVTGPSSYAWERGAEALVETRVVSTDPSLPLPDGVLVAREAELQALGAEAAAATTLPERAAIYGRSLVTCGGCHKAAGVELPAYKAAPPG